MRIEIAFDVDSIKLSAQQGEPGEKELPCKVTLEASLSPIAIARILNLARQQVPLKAVVGTPQLAYDLEMLDKGTGEVTPAPKPQEVLGLPLEVK